LCNLAIINTYLENASVKLEVAIVFSPMHNRYFHVNFGFNTYLFDWLHGTLRRPDREYGEDIFGGKGRKKED